MKNEHDAAKSGRGSSPPENVETIYSDWLKRPRSTGTSTPGSAPVEPPGADLDKEPE